MRHTHPPRRGFTFKDLIVVVAIIIAIITLLLPTLNAAREKANRWKCASNLRSLGQALILYANENGGNYPRTTYAPGPEVIPVAGTGVSATTPFAPDGPQPNDITAPTFLLSRTQDVGSEVFTCPSSRSVKDDFGGPPRHALYQSNFSDYRKNLSYSFANPYPDDAAIGAKYTLNTTVLGPTFATAADLNPGPVANPALLAVTPASSSRQFRAANSPNHAGRGQNVLYGDGHVDWQDNPLAGVNRDNIYTNKNGQVMASPTDKDDSLLLPAKD